jgi:hypothetical protein
MISVVQRDSFAYDAYIALLPNSAKRVRRNAPAASSVDLSIYPGPSPNDKQVTSLFSEFEGKRDRLYHTVQEKRLQILLPDDQGRVRYEDYYRALVDEKGMQEIVHLIRVILGRSPRDFMGIDKHMESHPADKALRNAHTELGRIRSTVSYMGKYVGEAIAKEFPSVYDTDAPASLTRCKEVLQWELYCFHLCVPADLKWRNKLASIGDERYNASHKFKEQLQMHHGHFHRLKSLCEAAGVEWPAEEEWKDLENLFLIAAS